jgi:hypothetical protein
LLIKIELNKNLFAAYVGLSIAGYDLADKQDKEVAVLCSRIRNMGCPLSVINYFACARTIPNQINPYWPRGSLLSSACYFISVEKSSRYNTFNDFMEFVRSLDNIDPKEINDELINWLREVPRFIDAVTGNDIFDDLWNDYQKIISSCSEKHTAVLNSAERAINSFSASSKSKMPNIVFSPNLLQSPFIADCVTKSNVIYIIRTSPDVLPVIHEFLHYAIKPQRDYLREYIRKYDNTQIADFTKLATSGYMWNTSEEAKLNALEESFVRGISIALTAKFSNFEKMDDFLHRDIESGFKLVPPITQSALNNMPNNDNIHDFTVGFLDSI